MEALLAHLLTLAGAEDKAVRSRVCQLLALVVTGLPDDFDMSEELLEALQAAMLQRLRDKVHLSCVIHSQAFMPGTP